jgi:hypothetical protein
MRRLLRILFNVATVVSALLCVMMAGLWARGYWVTDQLMSTSGRRVGAGLELRNADLIAKRGHVGVYLRRLWDDGDPHDAYARFYLLGLVDHFERAGGWAYFRTDVGWPYRDDAPVWKPLRWERGERRVGTGIIERGTTVELADWVVVAVLGLPPFVILRRWRGHSSRRDGGLCQTCGYDLRATPDRCPECGIAPSEAWERRTRCKDTL